MNSNGNVFVIYISSPLSPSLMVRVHINVKSLNYHSVAYMREKVTT